MHFTFSAWFSGTSRVANKFSKPKNRTPSHLKTLHGGALRGCSTFHSPASNSSCKLMIQVAGRNARLSYLTSSQMPSIHSGSPGPDWIQATGSLRPERKSRIEWIILCCGSRTGLVMFYCHAILQFPGTYHSGFSLQFGPHFNHSFTSFFFPPFPFLLSISVSLSWTDSHIDKASLQLAV